MNKQSQSARRGEYPFFSKSREGPTSANARTAVPVPLAVGQWTLNGAGAGVIRPLAGSDSNIPGPRCTRKRRPCRPCSEPRALTVTTAGEDYFSHQSYGGGLDLRLDEGEDLGSSNLGYAENEYPHPPGRGILTAEPRSRRTLCIRKCELVRFLGSGNGSAYPKLLEPKPALHRSYS